MRSEQYELLWFKCSLSGVSSSLIYCVLYHPPKPIYDSDQLIDDLVADVKGLALVYPDAVISIIGDLNDLEHGRLENESGMEQLIHDVTHGRRTIDKFLTTHPHLFRTYARKSGIVTKHSAIIAKVTETFVTSKTNSANKRAIVSVPDIRAQHISLLKQTMSRYTWNAICGVGNDVEATYQQFLLIVRQLFNPKNTKGVNLTPHRFFQIFSKNP